MKRDAFDELEARELARFLAGGPKLKSRAQWMRQQHRAFVRLVKKQADELNPTISVENWGKGYIEACTDLLAALAAKGKGGKR